MQKQKQKIKFSQAAVNLHQFQNQIFLGFCSEQAAIISEYESSFVCGKPLWLKKPNEKLLKCDICLSQNLTFLCQIFCPLNADHCYNRILYVLFCEKCRRCFRCLKQQTASNWQPSQELLNLKCGVRIIQQKAYEIQSQSYQKKQLLKTLNKSKLQVQEEAIIQQAFQQDEQDQKGQKQQLSDLEIQKISQENFKNNKFVQNIQKQNHEQYEQLQQQIKSLKIGVNDKIDIKEKKIIEGQQKQKIDFVFEQYKKTIKVLNNPIMLYSNVPVAYNSFSLNHKHFCKWCESKLQMQVQLTQQFLLINKNLVILDWGSLMIYTCSASCQKSDEECVVVQYQFDAISEQQVRKLKKKKKNKKKNKSKSKSKSNQKQKQKQEKSNQVKKQQKSQLKGKEINSAQNKQTQNQQGDWD